MTVFMSQHSLLIKILRIDCRELIESIGDGSLTIAPNLRRRRSAEKTRRIDQNNNIPTLAVRKASHCGWKRSRKNKEG
ncbi:hypothetical protein AHAS_Ahas20G0040100 [Arachis hypogaea]